MFNIATNKIRAVLIILSTIALIFTIIIIAVNRKPPQKATGGIDRIPIHKMAEVYKDVGDFDIPKPSEPIPTRPGSPC